MATVRQMALSGGTFPFWQCHRCTRSERFPTLHVVLAGKAEHLLDNRLNALAVAVRGITVAVLATTLPRLRRGEPCTKSAVAPRAVAANATPNRSAADRPARPLAKPEGDPGQALPRGGLPMPGDGAGLLPCRASGRNAGATCAPSRQAGRSHSATRTAAAACGASRRCASSPIRERRW
ncbi:hypothetical protein GCM10012280_69160 [Wenjunlia tyrosinilytica]|uniref:Uncharacterized protein n=1 Tax=Wenjunlia tyrosinilytica TaxID=1544741 RepID=A0A917ZZ07_9ACTN|nr:hypothetical protein GCM10012280_69160 [Wenjunlia tyrosinilytica]